MKNLLGFTFLFFTSMAFCQNTIVSGNFDSGLKLAFNASTKKVTGYYENATGENNQFSCIFYLEGTVAGNKFKVKTYFPNDESEDMIEGTMEIANSKSIQIKLPEEHGGCGNVQHFADEPVNFGLMEPANWIQISYIVNSKSYFHKGKSDADKLKSYLLKNDVVCVEKIENGWAYCTYFGKKTTKGWLKIKDLNQL